MIFLHKAGNGRIVLQPSVFEYKKLAGQDGETRIPKWGKTVTFEEVAGGFRFNGRTWRGKKELNDPELIAMIYQHRNYGNDFVALEKDGDELDESFKVSHGGMITCVACDKTLANTQAWAGHKRSEDHQEEVAGFMDAAREALGAAGRPKQYGNPAEI